MSEKIYTSAKGLIDEHGLDPEAIEGTGKDGAVTKGDVERYLAEREAENAWPRPGTIGARILELVDGGMERAEVAEKLRSEGHEKVTTGRRLAGRRAGAPRAPPKIVRSPTIAPEAPGSSGLGAR